MKGCSMTKIRRRSFLTGAAAASALTATGSPLSAAPAQGQTPSKLTDIDHIIILMKENRSFDHYFGTLAGVRGFNDPTGASTFRQADKSNPDGHVLPFRLDTIKTSAQQLHDLSHAWGPQHQAWNAGAMDNWIAAHRQADGDDFGPLTMGYH